MNVEITCMLILLAEELFQLSIKVECSIKNVCKFRKETCTKSKTAIFPPGNYHDRVTFSCKDTNGMFTRYGEDMCLKD